MLLVAFDAYKLAVLDEQLLPATAVAAGTRRPSDRRKDINVCHANRLLEDKKMMFVRFAAMKPRPSSLITGRQNLSPCEMSKRGAPASRFQAAIWVGRSSCLLAGSATVSRPSRPLIAASATLALNPAAFG